MEKKFIAHTAVVHCSTFFSEYLMALVGEAQCDYIFMVYFKLPDV